MNEFRKWEHLYEQKKSIIIQFCLFIVLEVSVIHYTFLCIFVVFSRVGIIILLHGLNIFHSVHTVAPVTHITKNWFSLSENISCH